MNIHQQIALIEQDAREGKYGTGLEPDVSTWECRLFWGGFFGEQPPEDWKGRREYIYVKAGELHRMDFGDDLESLEPEE